MTEPTRLPEVVLKEAAEWLSAHSWCQNHFELYNMEQNEWESKVVVAACALGAIKQVMQSNREGALATQVLLKRIGCEAIPEWNDTPGRTKDEVLAALRGDLP